VVKIEKITEKSFRDILSKKNLEQHLKQRILKMFQLNTYLSYDVANVVLHAIDQDKVDSVLIKLAGIEEIIKEEKTIHQHPEAVVFLNKERIGGIFNDILVFLNLKNE